MLARLCGRYRLVASNSPNESADQPLVFSEILFKFVKSSILVLQFV